jgi:hypothetical protein
MEFCARNTLVSRRVSAPLIATLALVAVICTASPVSAAQPCKGRVGNLVSTANGSGQTLTAWEDGCSDEEGLLSYANTGVAVGSVIDGFKDLGGITSPAMLSEPTGVVLDDAGDGWVSGIDSRFAGYAGKYGGVNYAPNGGWLAFRPPGGSFGAPISLSGGDDVNATEIAGNASGQVLVAWTTSTNVYVAWASPTGLADVQRFNGPLNILGVSVDRQGQGLVIATGAEGPLANITRKVIAISGAFGRRFAAPRTVLIGARDRRTHISEYFYVPIVATSSGAGAVLASTTIWLEPNREEASRPERSFLLRVSASGTAGRWQPVPHLLPDFSAITTDAHGQVLLETGEGRFLSFDARGRLRARWYLQGGPEVSLVSNPRGQVAASWSDETSKYVAGLLGSVTGAHGHSVHVPTHESVSPVTATINEDGRGTLFWSEDLVGVPTIYAHAIAEGGPGIEVAREPVPATEPEQ